MSGKTYEELMEQLAPEQRKRVEKRAAELIAEEKSLRDLRKAHQLTQQRMARKLGVKQHSISRLEQRSDMLLSTLRDYIGKMGGELVLTAEFPDREPVRLKGFGEIAQPREPRKVGSTRASARPPKRAAKVRTAVRAEQTNRRRAEAS
jgi:DNA-binding XRE family transcriptional regulator